MVGDADAIGDGQYFEDYTETVVDVTADNLGDAAQEGLMHQQAETSKEQELTLDQLNEALHMPQQQVQQEYTEEQIRQIEQARIQQSQQQKNNQQEDESVDMDDR